MGVTAAVVSVAATAYSVDQQRSAAKKQRRAQQVQTNQQTVENKNARANAARENRIRKARILSMGEGVGIGGSSGIFGAMGSMDTKLGTAFAQQSTQANSAETIGDLNAGAQMNLFNADMAQGINDIFQSGKSIYNARNRK